MTTVLDLRRFKAEGRRFAMLTAYDYPIARLLDDAGIPVLLVGDSAAMVVHGHSSTLPITLDEMLVHARAVARGAPNALLVGDLPFLSYQGSLEDGVLNAGSFLKEGGMHAVKLEGGRALKPLVRRLVDAGIPVMGHLGLTPQSVHRLGGFKVQGKDSASAERILSDARELEDAGAFAVVLEGIPASLAAEVTAALSIPTIGIGAGPACDGQVLVVHDLLGLTIGHRPKFVKQYANLADEITQAARSYAKEVEEGVFPGPEHSYGPTISVVSDEVKYGG